MSDLSINNVINISVSQAGRGAGEYNTSNIGIMTHEAFNNDLFGTDGYKIYLSSTEVGKDFGTSSRTYKLASAVFAQTKNILAGGGYLVVIPKISQVQELTFDAIADSGDFKIDFNGAVSAIIPFNATPEDIQVILRSVVGMENVIVSGSIAGVLRVEFAGYDTLQNAVTVADNNLLDAATPVGIVVDQGIVQETTSQAIARSSTLVQYFGILSTLIESESEMLACGLALSDLRKLFAPVQISASCLEPGDSFDLIRQAGYEKVRGLYYGGTIDEALYYAAAYLSRGLSTNFNGSDTTQTQHLKDLVGVVADTTVTQSMIEKAESSGVDLYISIEGVPKVFTSGANNYFDRVYNKMWIVGRFAIDGFNILAKTDTKIPQTESGLDLQKGAYRKVCEQGIVNAYLAPGSWTRPDTFGVLEDFHSNIKEFGYYIYSAPLATQSPTDREARKAPLAQIAIKEAGAFHSADILVNINA